MSLLFSLPLALQVVTDAAPPQSPAQARLEQCLLVAATDAPSALAEAASWQDGTAGTELSYALQCQGQALVFLLRWDAAADSFLAARDARPRSAFEPRARLGTMAGNALFAGGDAAGALAVLDRAHGDALAASEAEMAGGIDVDRSRALVALDRPEEAETTLERARSLAPQNPEAWLLSATLARRQGNLERAGGWIGTALALSPRNVDILLEAGLIAALGGQDGRAREYWGAVQRLEPGSPQAALASGYLEQLDGLAQ